MSWHREVGMNDLRRGFILPVCTQYDICQLYTPERNIFIGMSRETLSLTEWRLLNQV